MCFAKTPKVVAPAATPQESDPAVVKARDAEMIRRRAAASNTNLTGGMGLTNTATTQVKTMMGQ